jgi:hypothetical protein
MPKNHLSTIIHVYSKGQIPPVFPLVVLFHKPPDIGEGEVIPSVITVHLSTTRDTGLVQMWCELFTYLPHNLSNCAVLWAYLYILWFTYIVYVKFTSLEEIIFPIRTSAVCYYLPLIIFATWILLY